jgi:hypothetical protein
MRAAIAVTAVLTIAAPRLARACGAGGSAYGYPVYRPSAAQLAALSVAAIDTTVLVWDGGSLIAGRDLSRGYGTFELILSIPQIGYGVSAIASANDSTTSRWAIAYTAGMAVMAAHGIWLLATTPSDGEEKRRVAVGPTHVPLGQLSQTGLGVVGRF